MTTSAWPGVYGHMPCPQESRVPGNGSQSQVYEAALSAILRPCWQHILVLTAQNYWANFPAAAQLVSKLTINTRKPLLQEVKLALNINHPVFLTQSVHHLRAARHSRHNLTHQLPLLPHNPLINHRAARHSLKYQPHPFSPYTIHYCEYSSWYTVWLQINGMSTVGFQGILGPGQGRAIFWPHLHTL